MAPSRCLTALKQTRSILILTCLNSARPVVARPGRVHQLPSILQVADALNRPWRARPVPSPISTPIALPLNLGRHHCCPVWMGYVVTDVPHAHTIGVSIIDCLQCALVKILLKTPFCHPNNTHALGHCRALRRRASPLSGIVSCPPWPLPGPILTLAAARCCETAGE